MTRKWIVTLGGAGLMPAMPGTWGSALAALFFYALTLAAGLAAMPIIFALCVIFSVLAVRLAPWAQQHFGVNDPRQFVLDEAVGQWVTLIFLPLSCQPGAMAVAGFFLFRGCDIAKPFPIRAIERLPGGWGILLDDVAAGVYANAALWTFSALVNWLLIPA